MPIVASDDAISIIGLVVSATGLLIAVVAAWFAKQAVDLAEKQFDLARDEHAFWKSEREKSPKLKISLSSQAADEHGRLNVRASATYFRLIINLKNVGTRESGPTTIAVFAPAFTGRGLTPLQWTGPQGEPLDAPGATPSPMASDEVLRTSDGKELKAITIGQLRPHVTLTENIEMYVTVNLEIPQDGSTLLVPFTAVASSDTSVPAMDHFELALSQ